MRRTDELDRLLLRAVCDDFVTLDAIVAKIGRRVETGKGNSQLLYNKLLSLIGDKLVSAFLLHADPPYITPVKRNSPAFASSWFFITQRGRKCLANSSRAAGAHAAGDSTISDDFTTAVNF
ncbi:hypothetical protein DYQ86_21725 [Acidobacteria bacterium AB60]|nr:hypothetical protein DYQ86_21725 [Acidobacteria bacterium AB60]